MTHRHARRHEWHQTTRGWTRSFGDRGLRIRLFQKRKGGTFYRFVWRSGRGANEKCLHTTDRTEAEHLVRQLLARATLQEPERVSLGPLTLGVLLERYCTECATFLARTEQGQREVRTRVKVLVKYFTPDCDVTDLTAVDVTAYTRWRVQGKIEYGRHPVSGAPLRTRSVRIRSAESDMKVLYAALRWATTVRVGKGKRLLDFHPLQGIRRPREPNPKRPVATWERYQQTRLATQQLVVQAEAARLAAKSDAGRLAADADRDKWIRVELFVVFLEATGRRAGSIRQLRWEDINLTAGEITWRAAADKKRHDWLTPIPPALVQELRVFQRKLGVVGGWVFPSEKRPSEPVRGDVLPRQLLAAEKAAGLSKLDGGLCHPYRRKWATERKHLSIKDVAAAGGWKDTETLLTCYQHADRETMLAVMSEPRKVTDGGVAGGAG